MVTDFLKRFSQKTANLVACFSILLVTSNVYAATCVISTQPSPPDITTGGSIDFSGSVSGKSPYTYDWEFDGGTPSSSTSKNVNVTYNTAGDYTVMLAGTNSKRRNNECTASVIVHVTDGGGGNTPPTANDDSYNATTGVELSVPAPGVLGNDTDDGQLAPLTASLIF